MMNHCTKKLLRTVGTIKWLAESLLHPLLNVYLSLHAPLLLTFLTLLKTYQLPRIKYCLEANKVDWRILSHGKVLQHLPASLFLVTSVNSPQAKLDSNTKNE